MRPNPSSSNLSFFNPVVPFGSPVVQLPMPHDALLPMRCYASSRFVYFPSRLYSFTPCTVIFHRQVLQLFMYMQHLSTARTEDDTLINVMAYPSTGDLMGHLHMHLMAPDVHIVKNQT